MPTPSDVLLPYNAKYFGFVDTQQPLNSHWDITWSFTFALTGNEHAFCTFLTQNSSLLSGYPGHYLGYLGDIPYMLSEDGYILLDETGDKLLFEPNSGYNYDTAGVLAIAFDSTGYFALSSLTNPGVGLSSVKKNSIIIRDSNNNVVFNEALSSLDTNFHLASSTKSFQTLRFRFANGGTKISVDYKTDQTQYVTLTSIQLGYFDPTVYTILYPGLTFCSPISSTSTDISTLFVKNFHVQGNIHAPTYQVIESIPLYTSISPIFTSISGISSLPT